MKIPRRQSRKVTMTLLVGIVIWTIGTMLNTLKICVLNDRQEPFSHAKIREREERHIRCNQGEKHNIVFIKCMKCATETMATILRRFGYTRKLNFVLPVKKNLYLGWPYLMEDGDYRVTKKEFNILMEHSIFTPSLMSKLMPNNTVYISIIRDPWENFKSVFSYFGLGRIADVPEGQGQIIDYLRNILKYEEIYTSPEKNQLRLCIPDNFSMTRNLMSHCLGMPLGFPASRDNITGNMSAVNEYIMMLDSQFLHILIADYFVESLVLLKRLMCWSFKDILYHQSNVASYPFKYLVPKGDYYDIHRNWSHVDYLLFDHFNKTFWNKVAKEGPDFGEEVQVFRLTQMLVERFCFVEQNWNSPSVYLTIPRSRFNEAFNVSEEDCRLLNVYLLPSLWQQYFEQEGLTPENLPPVEQRPKPHKGCSIN
ncbi:hypothetical protein ACJMK2_036197 [Sinanodonta woodiana]|uniref:Uncharacterized protein n=1 Tax=Sinanodonta woodiana TaxID=1069815 RepID=A0ABD3WGG7_SINWO